MLSVIAIAFGGCLPVAERAIGNPSPDAVAIVAAYDGMKTYCDEGVTQHADSPPQRFSRCFSRDGRYLEQFEDGLDGTRLVRWGDEAMHRVWEGRALGPLRLTKRYGESPRCMPFNYGGVGTDFESRALGEVFGLLGPMNRTMAINSLSRFHVASVVAPPGMAVFERLGEVQSSRVISRELMFVRQSDNLVMEYQLFFEDLLVESAKVAVAIVDPVLTDEQLAFDVPLMSFAPWRLVGLAWNILFFGAPIYVCVRLLRQPASGTRRFAGGIAWIGAWVATVVFTVLYVLFGAWYQEHASLAQNVVSGVIMLALYVMLPISMIVFARLKIAR